MPDTGDLGNLNSQEWQKLQELADSLEAAWNKGESVDLARFLPPAGTHTRVTILHELIKTDLECRWRHGQAAGLDDLTQVKWHSAGQNEGMNVSLLNLAVSGQ